MLLRRERRLDGGSLSLGVLMLWFALGWIALDVLFVIVWARFRAPARRSVRRVHGDYDPLD